MKKALVIGGTSGIGGVIANVLDDEHNVTRVGRKEWNFVTEPCPYDLADFDVLVFSAGAEFGGDQNFVTQSINDTELTLQTNLNSQIRVFKDYVAAHQGPGHIIFVGSAHSCEGTAKHKLIYTVSRIAIREFILGARRELAESRPELRVSFIRPGRVRTNFLRNKYHGDITQEQEEEYYSTAPYMTVDELRPYIQDIVSGKLQHLQEIIFSAVPT